MGLRLEEISKQAIAGGRIDMEIWRELNILIHFLNRASRSNNPDVSEKLALLAEASSAMYEAFAEVDSALEQEQAQRKEAFAFSVGAGPRPAW